MEEMLADTNDYILLEDGNKDDVIMKKIDKLLKKFEHDTTKFEKDYTQF